jgi:hypothetical protein
VVAKSRYIVEVKTKQNGGAKIYVREMTKKGLAASGDSNRDGWHLLVEILVQLFRHGHWKEMSSWKDVEKRCLLFSALVEDVESVVKGREVRHFRLSELPFIVDVGAAVARL